MPCGSLVMPEAYTDLDETLNAAVIVRLVRTHDRGDDAFLAFHAVVGLIPCAYEANTLQ